MGSSTSKKQPPVIARCSSPAYCVKIVGSRHILLGGGGGAAKTGVSNQIEVCLLFKIIIIAVFYHLVYSLALSSFFLM